MLSQIGSAAEFSQMNVLQQEALAKAVGMTADELANSLVQQENLNKLGSNTKKQIQEQVKLLKEQGRTEEANQLMASLGNEDKAKAALLEIDAQEKFNVAIEKLQSILSNIVNGPAMILAQTLANIVSDAANLERIFTTIKLIIVGLGAMKLAGLIAQLGSAAIAAGLLSAGAITAASAITFGIGAIAIVAGIASMMGAFDDAKTKAETDAANAAKVKDGIIGSNGLVVGKYNKGQIQPIAQGLPEDNVIFTTNN